MLEAEFQTSAGLTVDRDLQSSCSTSDAASSAADVGLQAPSQSIAYRIVCSFQASPLLPAHLRPATVRSLSLQQKQSSTALGTSCTHGYYTAELQAHHYGRRLRAAHDLASQCATAASPRQFDEVGCAAHLAAASLRLLRPAKRPVSLLLQHA